MHPAPLWLQRCRLARNLHQSLSITAEPVVFLRMLERGLAYRKKSRVNWCPKCCTVLANEQVVNGGYCWRHEDTPSSSPANSSCALKTTAYADQLVDDLKQPKALGPSVITMQRNWIGRSQGARVKFAVADLKTAKPIEIFTTRIDTIYGATAIILAPTHPLVAKLLDGSPNRVEAESQLAQMKLASVKTEDLATAEKVGFFTGRPRRQSILAAKKSPSGLAILF